MPDFINDPDDPIFDERDEDNVDIRRLRGNARKAAALARENTSLAEQVAALTRQTAFASAGLNLSEKQQAALLAAHGDTELTADALKATAAEIGLIAPAPAVDAEQEQRTQVAQAHADIASAAAGSTPPDALPDIPTRIIAAEQAGDWDAAMALKAEHVAAQMARM